MELSERGQSIRRARTGTEEEWERKSPRACPADRAMPAIVQKVLGLRDNDGSSAETSRSGARRPTHPAHSRRPRGAAVIVQFGGREGEGGPNPDLQHRSPPPPFLQPSFKTVTDCRKEGSLGGVSETLQQEEDGRGRGARVEK